MGRLPRLTLLYEVTVDDPDAYSEAWIGGFAGMASEDRVIRKQSGGQVELLRKLRRLYLMIWRLRTASSAAIMSDNNRPAGERTKPRSLCQRRVLERGHTCE